MATVSSNASISVVIVAGCETDSRTKGSHALIQVCGANTTAAVSCVGVTGSPIHTMVILRALVRVSNAVLGQIALPCSSTTLAALGPECALTGTAGTSCALCPSGQLAGGSIAARIRALCLTATVAHLVSLSYPVPTDWVAHHLCGGVEEALVSTRVDELIHVADAAATPACGGWEAGNCRHDALVVRTSAASTIIVIHVENVTKFVSNCCCQTVEGSATILAESSGGCSGAYSAHGAYKSYPHSATSDVNASNEHGTVILHIRQSASDIGSECVQERLWFRLNGNHVPRSEGYGASEDNANVELLIEHVCTVGYGEGSLDSC